MKWIIIISKTKNQESIYIISQITTSIIIFKTKEHELKMPFNAKIFLKNSMNSILFYS